MQQCWLDAALLDTDVMLGIWRHGLILGASKRRGTESKRTATEWNIGMEYAGSTAPQRVE